MTELAPRYLVYCWPAMFLPQPGLGHMKEIARTLLIEAFLTRRVALLPPLVSNPMHNPAKRGRLRWADYFDWSDLPVSDPQWDDRKQLRNFLRRQRDVRIVDGGTPFASDENDCATVIRCFSSPNVFGDWIADKDTRAPEVLREPAFSDRYPSIIREHAAAVVAEIGQPVGVLHIRRGDLAGPETEPAAVASYLGEKGIGREDLVYVLTNERDPGYAAELRRKYPRIVFEHEVRHLRQLPPDNYLTFRIGKCLQWQFDARSLGTLRFMRFAGPNEKPTNWSSRFRSRLQQLRDARRLVSPVWLNSQKPT